MTDPIWHNADDIRKIAELEAKLSRYEAATVVGGMVHEWNYAKSSYLGQVGHMEMPKELIGKRVRVRIMPEGET